MGADRRRGVLWACVLAVSGPAAPGALGGGSATRPATHPATRATSRPTTRPAEIVIRTGAPKTTLRLISPGTGAKTPLRLTWPTGRYQVREKSVSPHIVTRDTQTTEIQRETEVTHDFVLGPADKNGVRRLHGRCKRVRIRMESDALDSAVPGWERQQEGGREIDLVILRAQVGMTIIAVLDKAQRVTRIVCRPGPLSADNPEHFREFGAFMARNAAKEVSSLFDLNRLLPVQPVAPGATWGARYTERVPGWHKSSYELTWKLTGIEKTQLGRVATLTYEGRVKIQPQERGDDVPKRLDVQSTGTLRLALDAGRLTEGFHRCKFRPPKLDRDISIEYVVEVEPIPRKKR